jgi:hypothetical protein
MAISSDTLIPAIITAGASFAGATLAQILSHAFTLRRETLAKIRAAKNYQLHLTFDMVSVVADLERTLRAVGLLEGKGQYKTLRSDTLRLGHPTDTYSKLAFDAYVGPQFMLNARKFFLQSEQTMTYVRSLEPEHKLSDFTVFFLAALYLQGLSYIVASIKNIQRKPHLFGKPNRTPIGPLTYDQVVQVYNADIGYAVPDRAIFDAAEKLDAEVGKDLKPKTASAELTETVPAQ